jgi:hypothetical protein
MVITTEGLDLMKASALNTLDNMDYVAFGSGTTAESSSQTALATEEIRVALDSATKDTALGTYDFSGRLSLSQANTTLTEFGLFDASSSGNMGARVLLDSSFTKTADDEVLVVYRVSVGVTNS